ncbi:serine/threonine-protein kinase pats1 [Mizuhopecten yessoensis]|uniref:non-specific serine/threonine protein kinase n=1 Tax=Mizuhopecten yessoensis TaxID=6573 RepID=A0A210PZ49_MIZYE|nr:serine/threonine-protein kinase pats1 [Mizuhopecten yessoensis]
MTNKQVTVSDIIYDGSFCLSQKAKEKYSKYFKSTKKKDEHFLTGAEVAFIVKDKRLSKLDLFQVWKFADADEDGRLSIDEFCLAMAMIDMLKERRATPDFTVLKKSGLRVTIQIGNIEKAESDMIVCALRQVSRISLARGLLSTSIYLAGGLELQKTLDRKYPDGLKDGQIVVIPVQGDLKCSSVLFGTIPEYTEPSNLNAVHKFINDCLQTACDHGAKSISFPSFGTGALGYQKIDIANVLFEALANFPSRKSLEDVFLVIHRHDKASLCVFKEAEQRHLDLADEKPRSTASKTVERKGFFTSGTSCASVEKRLEYEKIFMEYAGKNTAYSMTGKCLSSILLQTGVCIYAVQQIMEVLHKTDYNQVHIEEFIQAYALLDKVREGYLLPDVSLYLPFLIGNEIIDNILNQQHIFDPRYCLSWFYPRDMKLGAADGILKKTGRRDGSFLVWRRKKDDFYHLGTIYGQNTYHLRIDISSTNMYSVKRSGIAFQQLGSLIKHYMTYPLPDLPAGNLRLKYPIPVNIPSTKSWFYPNISPTSAIVLLHMAVPYHSFIVRYSMDTPGCCALVIRTKESTVPFKIIHKHGFHCLQGGEDTAERFRNIDTLVDYYHSNPIYYSSSRQPLYCKPVLIHPNTSSYLPVCSHHPKAPLVEGNTEDELLCMDCSEKVQRHFIGEVKLEEYRETFRRLDSESLSIGLLTESSVKAFLCDKGVLEDALSKIWELSDVDGDTFLNEDEFCIAMYLADLALTHKMLPPGLPPTLKPPFGAKEEEDLPEEILQMDQRSIQLYRECLEEEEEADYHIRVIVIGQTGVGKTTLTRNLLRLPRIRPQAKILSTDGVDIHSSFVSLHDNSWVTDDTEMRKASKTRDAKLIKLLQSSNSLKNEISAISGEADPKTADDHDNSGDDSSDQTFTPKEYASKSDDVSFSLDESDNDAPTKMGTEAFSPSQIFTKTDSFLSCKEFLQTVRAFEKAKFEPSASDEGQTEGQTGDDPFLKTVRDLVMSQKDSIADLDDMNYGELSVWDFAGQFVFYTTHHTFLTPRAVYLLVTRLDQSLTDIIDNDQCFLDATGCKEMKIGDLVSYWMNSVHTYSHSVDHLPPVILVGTHLDKVEGDTEKKTKYYFEELRKSLLNKPTSRHLIDRDYTVSSTPDEQEIESLRQKIVELASKQKYWGEKIPARWIALEKAMMEQKLKGVSVMPYEEVVELDKSTGVPINDKEKLDLFLRFQHAIGNMIYFSEGCLRDHIVLNPQWLIDAFKCIITARQFCINNPALVQHWDDLNSTGRLHQCMVEGIFRKEDRFCLHKVHILGLMERLDILSRPFVYQDADTSQPTLQEFYFVPSLLQGKFTECQMNDFVPCTNRTPFLCYVFKNNFLPPAVFHRLLAACLSKYPVAKQGSKYLMFCGCGIFDLNRGLTRLVVTFYDNIIQIGLFRFSAKSSPESSMCVSVRKFVTETLKRVLGRYCMNLPFTLSLKCEEGRLLSHEGMLPVEDLTSGGEEVACHGHDRSHTINRQRHLQAWYPDEIQATDINPESKGDQLMCLNFGQLNAIPDDLELTRISAKIGKEFETLARYLGIDDAEIFQIRSDHQLDTRSQIYHTLVRWKQKSGRHATYHWKPFGLMDTR